MRRDWLGCAAAVAVLWAVSAEAGGFSRGVADTDILYEDGNFNMRAISHVVVARQELTASPVLGGSDVTGTQYLDNYVIPSAAVKFRLSENLSCAGTLTDAYGADSSYAAPFGPSGTLSDEFVVTEYGATCAAFVPLGPGRLAVLGGGFVESFNYDLLSAPDALLGAQLDLSLRSNAYGWRAGLGYEVPEIGLRAQLLYRSSTTHNGTGTAMSAVIPPAGSGPASATGVLPQSVELKVQSGLAPGWLALGSVRWTDWSVLDTFDVTTPLGPFSRPYHWRDGWTVTGGIGHAFSDSVSGVVSLQWDRGVSTGYDFRSDKWLLAAGVGLKDSLGGELRLGGAVAYMTGTRLTPPSPDVGAAVGTGWAGVLSAGYSVKW